MGAVFRAPRLRDPRVVPTEPVEVDWSHPLAVGLIGLWTPSAGTANLAQPEMTLLNANGTVPALTTTSAGEAWAQNDAVSGALYGVATPIFLTGMDFTTFWLGMSLGSYIGNYDAPLCGTTAANTDVSPYIGYAVERSGDTLVSRVGASPSSGVAIPSPGVLFSCGATIMGASGSHLYINGVYQIFGYSAPMTFTATAQVVVGGYTATSGRSPNVATNLALIYNVQDDTNNSSNRMAWLDAEPFAMLRPKMRRRYFTVSSGSIITTRGILAAEWLATQQAKEVVATEMSGLLSRSSEVFAEFDQAVIRNDAVSLEIAATAKKTATIPTEYDGATLSALPTPIEYLGLAATSEQSSLEYLGSTMAEGTIPAEWLATSVASAIVPIEWAGAALVTSGATIALEWMAPLSGGLVSSVEFLTALGTNVTLNADWSDAVLSNVTVTFETGKVLQVSDIVAADWAATLSAANIIPADWIAGRSISLTIPIEWTGSAGAAVQANALMPIEWAVASLIVPDWRFAVTFLPTIERVGFQTPVDEIGFNEPIDEVVLI